MLRLALTLSVGSLLFSGHAIAATLVGRATVTDGDSIEINGDRIRLHGVDAPESAQECLDADRLPWRCGQLAATALDEFLTASRPTSCEVVDVDQYGRLVAVCGVLMQPR